MRIIMLSACAAATLTGTAAARDLDAMGAEALLPLAQAEGRVTVYAFTSRIGQVEAAFEAAYPGIDMVGFDMSSTEMIARLRSEAAAGIANADVIYVSDAPVVLSELLEAGLIAAHVPPRLDAVLPETAKAPLLQQRLSTKVLLYNEESYPDGAPVDSLWDLTRPEWASRVVMVDPLQRGDYLDLMTQIALSAEEMAEAYAVEFGRPIALDAGVADAGRQFIVDLFENDVVLFGSTDDVNVAIGTVGQAAAPIGFTTYSDRRDNADEGWALQVANEVAPANGIVFPALLGLNPQAPNPAAARLAVDFMMGDDSDTGGPGFAPFHVAGDWATRTDIAPHPDAIPLEAFNGWRIDPREIATLRAEIADLILQLQ